MRIATFVAKAAIGAVLSMPAAFVVTLAGTGSAAAQFAPPQGGGMRGGPEIEFFDPCEFRDCYRPRRPPPPRYRPRGEGPNVIVVPRRGYYPDYGPPDTYEEYYEEDVGPRVRPMKPKAKPRSKPRQAKPKKKPSNTGGAASGQVAGRDYRPDEVLVEFPLATTQEQVDALAQQQQIEQLGSQEISLLGTRIHRWRITDGRAPETVAAALRGSANVSDAHLNRVYSLQEDKPSDGPPQYAATKLKLDEVRPVSQGEDVLVALIDSGADAGHPELAGSVAETFDAVGNSSGPHAHGTGMAGAIVAHDKVAGVAPKAKILNVRAFAPNGKTEDGTTFDIVRGMDWAAQKGARIFNLSFAGPRDPLLSRVVQAALEKKIVVVAAAGNAGPDSPPLYPAADKGVIAVTATDSEDAVMKMANRGGYVTMAAPGVDILLPAPNKAYAVSSGTSIATAYVSGVAALMIATNPDIGGDDVYEILTGTARDLGAKGRDKEFGAGLADPAAALEVMQPIPQTVAAPADTTEAEKPSQ